MRRRCGEAIGGGAPAGLTRNPPHSGRPHRPKTYSTVALRCSLSSGVRTSLLWEAVLGPDATATYCLPFTSNVIGGAAKPDPTLIFHSWSRVVSSKAATVPSSSARNTSPPAVVNYNGMLWGGRPEREMACIATGRPASTNVRPGWLSAPGALQFAAQLSRKCFRSLLPLPPSQEQDQTHDVLALLRQVGVDGDRGRVPFIMEHDIFR